MEQATNPDIRVYLFTYRRHDTLPRSLESLLKQTHVNWVCELHNDDPSDDFPKQLVEKVNDPRIQYVAHEQNLGALCSFNLAFKPVSEPYISILEDDNWWEPDFLATLYKAMTDHPHVKVGWANMYLWYETNSNSWERKGTIWPPSANRESIEFVTPHPRQICGALHSNGAMLVKTCNQTMFDVPASLPFFAIEHVRERKYPGPLLLISEPLANFAVTHVSARAETADDNMRIHVLLAKTFLKYARISSDFYSQMWIACRGALGHKQRALIVAAIQSGQLFKMVKGANLADLILVFAWIVRHPFRFKTLFEAEIRFPEVFAFLDVASRSLEIEQKVGLSQDKQVTIAFNNESSQ